MQLLIQAAMVFFGTLMMAGLVALGTQPGGRWSAVDEVAPVMEAAQQLFASMGSRSAGIAPAGR